MMSFDQTYYNETPMVRGLATDNNNMQSVYTDGKHGNNMILQT